MENKVLKNFIVFEGIDGAGTSTQIKILSERADSDDFFLTAEPTSGETGKFLRRMLKGDIKLDARTTAFLFAADRNEHLYGKDENLGLGIVEKAKNGKIVVSDRYLFSNLAYQSVTCGEELPKMLNSTFPLPEILFFFQIDPNVALKRVESRNGTREIYERLDYLCRTENQYEKVISDYEKQNSGMKIIRLDASKSVEKVADKINSELENMKLSKFS